MWQVWGLKNCDTCRKARKWLEAEGVGHSFRDLRGEALSHDDVARWLAQVGGEKLINRRGTTWRCLSDAEKAQADTDDGALALCMAQSALMKRPIFDDGARVMVGFTATEQAELKG